MSKRKFEVLMHVRETASLDRPAWTSTQSTGMFNAYRHKHTTLGGRFTLLRNYFNRKGK